jgi:hypothetical protein
MGDWMSDNKKHRILIDLERQNRLNAQGCPACRKKFNLGDEVVLARGKWQGYQYVHLREAVLEKSTDTYYERRFYADMKRKPSEK